MLLLFHFIFEHGKRKHDIEAAMREFSNCSSDIDQNSVKIFFFNPYLLIAFEEHHSKGASAMDGGRQDDLSLLVHAF